MSSARPRRSAAPKTLRIGFPDLSGSSDEGDGGAGGDGSPDKDAPDDGGGLDNESEPESASGSEYAPEVPKEGEEQPPSEADSAEFEEGDPESEEDGDSAAGEAELDDISIAASENLPLHERLPSPGGKQSDSRRSKGKGRALVFQSEVNGLANSSTSAARTSGPVLNVVGREGPLNGTLSSAHGFSRKSVPRRKAQPVVLGAGKKTPFYDLTYGASYTLPVRLQLTHDFDSDAHCPKKKVRASQLQQQDEDAIGLQETAPLTETQKLYAIKREAYLPFGPIWETCEDFGWYKGRIAWQEDQEGHIVYSRPPRWGGWYDEVLLEDPSLDVVTDVESIIPHLPRNVYPAQPTQVNLEVADKGGKLENDDEDMWDPNSEGNPFQMPTKEELSGTAAGSALLSYPSNAATAFSASGGPRNAAEKEQDDGIVRIYLGLLDSKDGNDATQAQTLHEIERFSSLRLDSYLPNKPGFLLNAGGPVLGLDWCPQADGSVPAACEYLAVSTISELHSLRYRIDSSGPSRPGLIQIWSLDTSVASDLGISTSDVTKGRGMILEVALLVESEAMQLAWCPRGGAREGADETSEVNAMAIDGEATGSNLRRLGILAALTAEGSMLLYQVPCPADVRRSKSLPADDLAFLRPKAPLLKLDLGNIPATCFEWANHDMIVVGTATGCIATFHVESALAEGEMVVTATHVVAMHEAPVRSVTVVREPALSNDGQSDLAGDPTRIATAGLDGATKLVDLLDWAIVSDFGHERAIRVATRYSPSTGSLLFADQDMALRVLGLRAREYGASTRITAHRGPIKDIACSDHHSFFATASADGTCGIMNAMRRLKRGNHGTHYLNRMYRVDFSRKTGEYRMIDNIMPDARLSYEAASYARKRSKGQKKRQKKAASSTRAGGVEEMNQVEQEEEEEEDDDDDDFPDPEILATASWSPEVSVNRVAWHKSLRRAHLLASGMACGLVRVDVTTGTFTFEASVLVRTTPMIKDDAEDDDQ